MLRVPGTLNSKCKEAGIDAEVKILQKWDGHRPDYKLILGSFYADLIGKNQQLYREYKQQQQKNQYNMRSFGIPKDLPTTIYWIERLLQTPIEEYRKRARDLILVPYLVLRRGVTDPAQVSDIVMSWADKCGELRRLEPSRGEFKHKIRTRVYDVIHDRIPQMRLATLKERNPELYEKLLGGGACLCM